MSKQAISLERVAFKPLNASPAPDSDYDINDEDEEDQNFSRANSSEFEHFSLFSDLPQSQFKYANHGMLWFRPTYILHIVAFIFILLLFANLFSPDHITQESSANNGAERNPISIVESISDRTSSNSARPSPVLSSPSSSTPFSASSSPFGMHPNANLSSDPRRPQYDYYMTSVLHELNSLDRVYVSGGPFDDLSATVKMEPRTITSVQLNSTEHKNIEKWWSVNFRNNHQYVTVTNYIRAMKSFTHGTTITLTTQATTDFLHHTVELCKRWDGPLSIAVFCPGTAMTTAITLIKFMRQCLPSPLSACIRDKVTWHLVYNRSLGPSSDSIDYPKRYLDYQNHLSFAEHEQCPKLPPQDPVEVVRQFEKQLRNGGSKVENKLRPPYPINVLRNTARLAVTTKYVLASDIELYPSINIVPMFANLINNNIIGREYSYVKKFVLTLPIFEVKANVTPPKIKSELIDLFTKGDAIFFHRWVCDACQNFPNRMDWLQTDESNRDELTLFAVTKRDKSRNSWEPIFIGTNQDPLYDDRLTWDGRRDKMAQMYEMCLQNYYLFVLGNAFIVHAPGIKHIDQNDVAKKMKFMKDNNAIYDETISRLKKQYPDNESC